MHIVGRISIGFICILALIAASFGACAPDERCQSDSDCNKGRCIANVCIVPPKAEASTEPARETGVEPPTDVNEPVTEPPTESKSESPPEPATSPDEPASIDEPAPSEPDVAIDGMDASEPTADIPETAKETAPEGTGKICARPEECADGLFCVLGKCQPKAQCKTDLDCTTGNFTTCIAGYCAPKQPNCKADGECLIGTICHKGNCVPGLNKTTCTHRSDCPANYNCDNGSCKRKNLRPPVACKNASVCKAWETCHQGLCVRKCTSPKDCPSVSVPQCNAGICVDPNLPKGVCNSDSDCEPRQYCDNGTCVTCMAKADCLADAGCKAGEKCLNGQCGVPCLNDVGCSGNFSICSQGMCRGAGYNPVGCPENQEICDLRITKVTCAGNRRMTVTVQNVGIGPAVGRFYLCHESQGPKKGCVGAIIMNYGNGGNIMAPRATLNVTVSWSVKPGDIIAVDRPNLILEASEINNVYQITQTCP